MASKSETSPLESPLETANRRIAELEALLEDQTDSERFRLVVESAPNGIIVANGQGEIVMVNHSAEKMFGYTREEMLSLKIEDLVPPSFRKGHAGMRTGFHDSLEVRQMGAGRDLFALRRDGTEIPVEIGLTPLPEKDGSLILSSILDITERKKAEEIRMESQAKLQFHSEILRNVHEAVFYLKANGDILDWNDGAHQVFGITTDEAVGKNLFRFMDKNGKNAFLKRLFPTAVKAGRAKEVIRCKLKNGRSLCIRAKASFLRQLDEEGFVVCANDITEQKRLEAAIVSISENEQRRIGQDIHDDLCSHLSGIACLTKAMETQMRKNQHPEAEMIARIAEMVSDAGTKARLIAKGLVPAALETQGIQGALEDLVKRSRDMFGVNCQVTVCESKAAESLSKSDCTQIFRIAQEAVSNAIKHSDADFIEVRLRRIGKKRVELGVRDNGKGMPTDLGNNDLGSTGLGLLTMRQRAEIIEADFDIHAAPGKGTEICCSVIAARDHE